MMLRMSGPVSVLVAAAQAVLWVTDGLHKLRAEYHPIQDLRTYRTWRMNNKRKVAR